MQVAHCTAHDTAQNVTATGIGRQNTISNQEAGRTQMVGNHTVRHIMRTIRIGIGGIGRCFDQGAHQIDVIVVVLALKDSGNSFQTHAGINRRLGQINAIAICHLFILHEDEVPDFNETVAVFVGTARRATPDVIAMVKEDFRTRTTRTGIAHRPEVIGGRNTDDAVIRQTANLFPKTMGFVIGVINRDQKLVFGKTIFLGDQVPGEFNRVFLEIIAKREVAEHFKEGVMAGGMTDIFKIVMFATGTHAFLRGGRA